jgi:hypothetical protein
LGLGNGNKETNNMLTGRKKEESEEKDQEEKRENKRNRD